jgi:hypothetical protein
MKRKRLSLEKEESIHRSIYRYTKVNSLSYILKLHLTTHFLNLYSNNFVVSRYVNCRLIFANFSNSD